MEEQNILPKLSMDAPWVMEGVRDFLGQMGVQESLAGLLSAVLLLLVVFLGAILAHFVARGLILRGVQRLVQRSKVKWDDVVLRWRVLERLSHLVPALVIYSGSPMALAEYPDAAAFFVGLAVLYMIFAGMMAVDAALNAFLESYRTFEISKEVPIKSFVQAAKIGVYFVGGVSALSIVLGQSPFYFLSGLGALTAVMMLIFKDPILGFVAGIQLSTNKMVAVGDWIQVPKAGADGDVLEVALTTVKVQNWDKTITTIPTYALISDSFINWRGMKSSGGRRIKRSVFIDMQTIRFCTEEMLERFSKITHIAAHIDRKKRELAEYNASHKVDLASLANGRRMTNIGTFRAYVVAYLKNHPMVNQEMTFLVRQLESGPHGLPIQIYVFCNDKVWANYESFQSDIFDHILAVVPEFGLRVFQNPTGADFRRLTGETG